MSTSPQTDLHVVAGSGRVLDMAGQWSIDVAGLIRESVWFEPFDEPCFDRFSTNGAHSSLTVHNA